MRHAPRACEFIQPIENMIFWETHCPRSEWSTPNRKTTLCDTRCQVHCRRHSSRLPKGSTHEFATMSHLQRGASLRIEGENWNFSNCSERLPKIGNRCPRSDDLPADLPKHPSPQPRIGRSLRHRGAGRISLLRAQLRDRSGISRYRRGSNQRLKDEKQQYTLVSPKMKIAENFITSNGRS